MPIAVQIPPYGMAGDKFKKVKDYRYGKTFVTTYTHTESRA